MEKGAALASYIIGLMLALYVCYFNLDSCTNIQEDPIGVCFI
jgi:hypothetical protein